MSDNKLNSLGFDEDDFLSNLEFLKAKYSAYDDGDSKEEPEDEKDANNTPAKETVTDIFTYDRGNDGEDLPTLGEDSDGDDIYSEHSFTFDGEKENSDKIKSYENDLYDETVILDDSDVFSYEKDEKASAIPEITDDDSPAWYLSGSVDYREEPVSEEPKAQEEAPAEEIGEPAEDVYSTADTPETLPKEDDNPPSWYLSGSTDYDEEPISDGPEVQEEAPSEAFYEESEEKIEDIYSEPTEEDVSVQEDGADEFSDLDDDNDIKVIKQSEKSAFVSALLDAASKANKEDDFSDSKPSKIKIKKEKAPKAPKKAKTERENAPGKNSNNKKRKIITVVIAVAIPVIIWLGMFLTDIILVKNWYTPFFSVEAKTYSDGSSTYVGAFYKIQFHVNEDNTEEIDRECLPWFVNGPNDK